MHKYTIVQTKISKATNKNVYSIHFIENCPNAVLARKKHITANTIGTAKKSLKITYVKDMFISPP